MALGRCLRLLNFDNFFVLTLALPYLLTSLFLTREELGLAGTARTRNTDETDWLPILNCFVLICTYRGIFSKEAVCGLLRPRRAVNTLSVGRVDSRTFVLCRTTALTSLWGVRGERENEKTRRQALSYPVSLRVSHCGAQLKVVCLHVSRLLLLAVEGCGNAPTALPSFSTRPSLVGSRTS